MRALEHLLPFLPDQVNFNRPLNLQFLHVEDINSSREDVRCESSLRIRRRGKGKRCYTCIKCLQKLETLMKRSEDAQPAWKGFPIFGEAKLSNKQAILSVHVDCQTTIGKRYSGRDGVSLGRDDDYGGCAFQGLSSRSFQTWYREVSVLAIIRDTRLFAS